MTPTRQQDVNPPCFHWDATQAMSQHRDVNPKEKRSNATQGSMEWMSPIDGLTTRI